MRMVTNLSDEKLNYLRASPICGEKSLYSCDSIGRMPRNLIPSRFQNPV